MPDKKIPLKFILSAIVILLVITVILGYLNYREERLPEGQIRLKAGNEVIGEITLAEVKKLPVVDKKLVIDSTAGLSKHKFTCTPLLGVFNHIDPEIVKQYKRVITIGADNYVSGINMEEVMEKNNVFLVYADNGLPLKSKTGGQDTMRIVILNDPFGQRFTNYLVEIKLE
ncbi:MAG: hypothetical protein ABFD08_00560 [Syntrophomonas sp.]